MICPICKKGETSVVDSRPTEDGTTIRRRRLCICGERFTTFERVQYREIMVIKKNGRKSPFDRDKLAKSIFIALKKNQKRIIYPPNQTALGSLLNHITRNADRETFQPMNVNFGLFPDVQSKEINGQKINKKNRRQMLSMQALHYSKIWSQKIHKLRKNF